MPHRTLGPGSLVASRFRLDDLLEADSGAWFWRATDLTLRRSVALHAVLSDDPRADDLLAAARRSATVSDPRLLRVLDALEEGGLVHVVHEWGSGTSLDRMLADDVLDPRRAAWLVREVAEAVAVGHRQGIAHGRLLPEKVLVTDAGSVKLIGFVVDAVLHDRPDRPDGPPIEVSPACDVLDLGALLYAALTGRWPGYPPSVVPPAPRDHGRFCRPRQVRSGVPGELDSLCDRVVNGDVRAARGAPESALDVAAALSRYLGDGLATRPLALPGSAGDPGRAAPAHDGEATQPGLPLFAQIEAAHLETARGEEARATPSPPRAEPDPRAVPDPPAVPDPRAVPDPPARATPAHWGPDRLVEPPAPSPASGRPGASTLRVAAAITLVILLLLAVVIGFELGRSGSGDEPDGAGASGSPSATPDAAPQAVALSAVRDFDPFQDGGTPEENPHLVPLATDGDPATAWETQTYNDGPVLAPYKEGVGLLLDLGDPAPVADVQVTLAGEPYDVTLLAAEADAGVPTGTAGLEPVASRTDASGTVTLAAGEPVEARYLVVWLTAVPSVEGGYRGAVAEVVVRS